MRSETRFRTLFRTLYRNFAPKTKGHSPQAMPFSNRRISFSQFPAASSALNQRHRNP